MEKVNDKDKSCTSKWLKMTNSGMKMKKNSLKALQEKEEKDEAKEMEK